MTLSEHEAALERLKLRKGDWVRVTRSVPSYDEGWCNVWNIEMDAYIGGVYEVYENPRLTNSGVHLAGGIFAFPAHVLELVSRAGESPSDRPGVDLLSVLMGGVK